jgi:ribosomal-protein-serine acetyltransferase
VNGRDLPWRTMPPRLPNEIRVGDLVLRRLGPGDAEELVAAMNASLESLQQWFVWASGVVSVEQQRARLAVGDSAFDEGSDFEFGLFDGAGEIVGSLRVNPRAGEGRAGIGYWVRSDRQGRGLASAAAAAAASAVLEHLPDVNAVEIQMDQANARSAGVARRAGFDLVQEVDREVEAPGHTGREFVWELTRSKRT